MQAKQVFVVWGLLAVSLLALGAAVLSGWYGMSADQPQMTGGNNGNGDGEPFSMCPPFCSEAAPAQEGVQPRIILRTDFWNDLEEGTTGGGHETHDYQSVPWIAQVTSVVRTFYLVGLIGFTVAAIGLVLRLKGLGGAKGFLSTLATLSLALVGFSVLHLSVMLPEAYNEELEQGYGRSPELAFWSAGTTTADGFWRNVTSGPAPGWYLATGGVLAGAAAFGFAFAADLRRAREVLLDDHAAAERYAEATAQRTHIMERIREGRV